MAGGFGAGLVEGMLGSWQKSREQQDEIKRQREKEAISNDLQIITSNAPDEVKKQALDRYTQAVSGKKAGSLPNSFSQRLFRMIGEATGAQPTGGAPQSKAATPPGGATGAPGAASPGAGLPAPPPLPEVPGDQTQGRPHLFPSTPDATPEDLLGVARAQGPASSVGGAPRPVAPAATSQPDTSAPTGFSTRAQLNAQLQAAQNIQNPFARQTAIANISKKLDALDASDVVQARETAVENLRSKHAIEEENNRAKNREAEEKSKAGKETKGAAISTRDARIDGQPVYDKTYPWERVVPYFVGGKAVRYEPAGMTAADEKTYNQARASAINNTKNRNPTNDQILDEWNHIQKIALDTEVKNSTRPTKAAGTGTAATATPQGKATIAQAAKNPGLDADAWDYILTRHLPSTGYGKEATQFKTGIVQRARQIEGEMGLNPADIVALRSATAADKSALAKMTWLDASVNQFEDTLNRNLKIAQNLNDKYDRTDVKFVNRIENWYRGQRNDSDVNNFMAQIKTLAPEYAKIMAGSTSAAGATVSGTADANELFDNTMSQGGFQSLIDNVIKPDLANRKAALEAAKSGMLDRLRGGTAMRNVGGGGGTDSGTTPPPAGGASQPGKPGSLDDFYKKYPELKPK